MPRPSAATNQNGSITGTDDIAMVKAARAAVADDLCKLQGDLRDPTAGQPKIDAEVSKIWDKIDKSFKKSLLEYNIRFDALPQDKQDYYRGLESYIFYDVMDKAQNANRSCSSI